MSDATIEDYVKMVFPLAIVSCVKDASSAWFSIYATIYHSITAGPAVYIKDSDGDTHGPVNFRYGLTHRFSEFELVSYIGDFNRDTAGIIVSKLCNAIMDQKGQE